jgi:hypothetical protein
MRAIVLLAVFALGLQAQSVHFGLKGGLPLNDAIDAAGDFKSDFKRFTLGPMVDIWLPGGLGVEANALFKKTGYTLSATGTTAAEGHNAATWEFPLLLKYRFPGEALRPYLSGGYVFRSIGDMARLERNKSHGVAFGAGLLLDLKLVKLSPEIRYTRWNNDVFGGSQGPITIKSVKNQAEFLVGFTF